MALPEIRRQVIAQQVGVTRLSGAGQGFFALAQGFDALSNSADQMFKVANARYQAEFEIDQRERLAELASKHKFDPDGFKEAWSAQIKGTVDAVPFTFRADAKRTLTRLGGLQAANIKTQTMERERALTNQAIDKVREQQRNELRVLSRSGRHGTPQWNEGYARYQQTLKRALDAKLINKEEYDLRVNATLDETSAEALGATMVKAYQSGGMQAAMKVRDDILKSDEFRSLSPERREAIAANAMRRVKEAQALARASAVKQTDETKTLVKNFFDGVPVKKDDLDARAKVHRAQGNEALALELETLGRVAAQVNDLRAGPIEDFNAAVRAANAAVQANPTSAEARRKADVLTRMRDIHLKKVKADAFSYGLSLNRDRIGPLPELDFSNPQNLAEGLKARREAAEFISAQFGFRVAPMTADELERFKVALKVPQATARTVYQAALVEGLGEDYARVIVGQLGKSDDTETRVLSWAMGLTNEEGRGGDARIINEGAEALKQNPKLSPSRNSKEFRRFMDEHLGSSMRLMPSARAAMEEAVRAAYAKLANDEGDTTGQLDVDRLERAVKIAGGSVVTVNGARVIAPRKDMSGAQFRGVLRSLSPSDLTVGGKAVVDAKGRKITPEMIARFGRLTNVGSGRYQVDFGGDPIKDPTRQRPFILDLNNVAPPPPRDPDDTPGGALDLPTGPQLR